jgi:hypothetical protein
VEIGKIGLEVGKLMSTKGILGRFGVDFISVLENGKWIHYAI